MCNKKRILDEELGWAGQVFDWWYMALRDGSEEISHYYYRCCTFQAGLAHTPLAALSRPVAGVRKKTAIITLPGSSNAVKENISALRYILKGCHSNYCCSCKGGVFDPNSLHLLSQYTHNTQ